MRLVLSHTFNKLLILSHIKTSQTNSQFNPAWWLSNRHLQTLAPKLFRLSLSLTTLSERIELPDGDFVDLAWTEMPSTDEPKPIVVILHGLEGSKDSHYAKGMLDAIKRKGWIGVLMHFRGCSGTINRHAISYHGAYINDVAHLTDLLVCRYPDSPLAILGFSLGGNVLTQYLSKTPNNPYKVASVICAPLDIESCSKRVNQGFSKLYQKYLLDMLKKSAALKIDIKLITHLSLAQLESIKTMFDFDDLVTAPLYNFSSAADYYAKSSGKNLLNTIKNPCLFIHSKDDPFLCHESTVPKTPLENNITFEISKAGGHVGFIYGNNPLKPKYWLEKRVPEFFTEFLKQLPINR